MNLASGGSPHSQSGRAVVSRWVCECWCCCLWGREGGGNTPGETGQKGCSYTCFPPSRPLVCPCLAGCSESEQERDRETAVAICHDVHTQTPSTFIRVTFLWVLNTLRPKQLKFWQTLNAYANYLTYIHIHVYIHDRTSLLAYMTLLKFTVWWRLQKLCSYVYLYFLIECLL